MLFDIAPSEMLLTVIVAVVVIGPKDLPLALRTAGRWMGKMRKVSNHFRTGIETMIREAEREDMEKKWREHNETIMQAHPQEMAPLSPALIEHAPPGEGEHDPARGEPPPPDAFASDDAFRDYVPGRSAMMAGYIPPAVDEPQLPLMPAEVPAAPAFRPDPAAHPAD